MKWNLHVFFFPYKIYGSFIERSQGQFPIWNRPGSACSTQQAIIPLGDSELF
jgi:hypothetical protein